MERRLVYASDRQVAEVSNSSCRLKLRTQASTHKHSVRRAMHRLSVDTKLEARRREFIAQSSTVKKAQRKAAECAEATMRCS